MKVLALTRYGDLGASSRLRMFQYLPHLARVGIDVHVQVLFDNATLAGRYAAGGYRKIDVLSRFANRISALRQRHHFDLLWIEKEALPLFPLWFESSLLAGVPYVLDFDDAVFHNYDLHRLWLIRRLFGDRIDRLMRKAALVVCGNDYLAQRARVAGAKRVDILETVIDERRYIPKDYTIIDPDKPLSVVWIGSPSTLTYVHMLGEPLKRLASALNFELKVIGGEVELPGVNVRCVPWVESTEVRDIRSSDIGVMPLFDTPWEQGKCGYKLIQYMACGLPVVASPIGANNDIVIDGVNGFLAAGSQQWVTHLSALIESASLRQSVGQAGRDLVEQKYCLSVAAPRLANWLAQAREGALAVS